MSRLLSRVEELLAERLGWRLTEERLEPVRRGLAGLLRRGLAAESLVTAAERCEPADPVFQALVQAVVVPETYFFREFAGIRATVLPDVLRQPHPCILSAGCSTGEEPYSLAMLLHECQRRATLVGADLCEGSLAVARSGVYGPWSFRGVAEEVRERHFEAAEGRFRLREEIRSQVAFRQLNLVESFPFSGLHLILCRHLFIYLAPPAARRLAASLHAALLPGGWLVVAACELNDELFADFERVVTDAAVLYRRPLSAPVVDPPAPLARPPVRRRVRPPLPTPLPDPYEPARQAADRGEWERAEELCRAALGRHPLRTELLQLLARVLEARQQLPAAVRAWRQVVYLDNNAVTAHLALAMLLRRLGEARSAIPHLQEVVRLLAGWDPDAPIPHSGGESAARLASVARSLLEES